MVLKENLELPVQIPAAQISPPRHASNAPHLQTLPAASQESTLELPSQVGATFAQGSTNKSKNKFIYSQIHFLAG